MIKIGASIVLVLFLVFLLGVPITFALGLVTLGAVIPTHYSLDVIVQQMFTGVDTFTLIAIPLFILAGQLMFRGGMSRRLVDFSNALMGHWPSGLAMVSVFASMFFAAITGSAIAATAAIGGLMIPLMVEQKYDPEFAAPLLAAAGSIGPIIPPSIPLLIYGVSAGVSIAALFLAGIVPGILMGVALMVYSYFLGKKRNYRGRETRAGLKEVLLTAKDAILALLTPVIIIGGILSGVFTATESAAIAVAYALVIGVLVYRELNLPTIWQLLKDSVVTTGVVLIVLSTASLFTWYLTIHHVPQELAAGIMEMVDTRVALLLSLNLILLLAGTFIDTVSNVVIFTPLFVPLAMQYGVDPVHFGVIMAVNLTIGMCTPPLGVCLFVSSSIAGISLREMMGDLLPLVVVLLVVLGVVTYVPESVMWLPELIAE